MIETSLPILVFEGLVAVLLVAAAVLCWRVDRRLAALRSGQDGVRAAIEDLVQATAQAQATIAQLRANGADTAAKLETQVKVARGLLDELRLVGASPATGAETIRRRQTLPRAPAGAGSAADLEVLR